MPTEAGRYQIKNAASWTLLDESIDGQRVVHGWTQVNQPNQYWDVTPILHNVAIIKNVGSGSYLRAGGAINGSKLFGSDTYLYNDSSWTLDQQEDGSVYITFYGGRFVADLDNGNAANGTIIHLWERNDGAKQQRWFFERV